MFITSDFYQQFAQGEFTSLGDPFRQAGFVVAQPLLGTLQICAPGQNRTRMRLLISVGVHGDEVTPIEMMALLLQHLSHEPQTLVVDLLLVVGNLEAVAKRQRFVQTDLNRLFSSRRSRSASAEAARADQLMQVATQFFAGHTNKLHLDLHSAIRPSIYPTFAIIPGCVELPLGPQQLFSWLGEAGIAAVVLSSQGGSATFSSFSHSNLDVTSCTVELGSIGQVDVSHFAVTQAAIMQLLRSGIVNSALNSDNNPMMFRTQYELIKQSNAFMFIDNLHLQNFAQFAPGTIVARDGEQIWQVGDKQEYILFPNPDVQIGLRAGVMVVRI